MDPDPASAAGRTTNADEVTRGCRVDTQNRNTGSWQRLEGYCSNRPCPHTHKTHTHTHTHTSIMDSIITHAWSANIPMLLHLQQFTYIAASTHARIHAWLHTYTYKCVQASRWLCVSLTALQGVFGMYEYLQCRSLNCLLVPTWR